MNQRKFFKSLAVGVTAVVVAPKLLLPKKGPEFRTYVGPDGIRMTIAVDPIWDNPPTQSCGYMIMDLGNNKIWINPYEWKAMEKWNHERQIELNKYWYGDRPE